MRRFRPFTGAAMELEVRPLTRHSRPVVLKMCGTAARPSRGELSPISRAATRRVVLRVNPAGCRCALPRLSGEEALDKLADGIEPQLKARLDEGEAAGSAPASQATHSLGCARHPVEGRLLSWMLNNRQLRSLVPESWNVG
jgi:hypothetical protein